VTTGEPIWLTVDFAGEVHQLGVDDELTFGRSAKNDLVIDEDNTRLHRRFGRIYFRDGSWWLKNIGRTLPISILDRASRSRVTLTSGRETSLTFKESSVTFSAGSTSYELMIDIVDDDESVRDISLDMTMTGLTIDQLPLVGEQRLLAIGLAEIALRNPHQPMSLPSNKAIAHRFGWPMTTFNRKLDRLCRKYADNGVPGLVGGPGQLASNRRQKLVDPKCRPPSRRPRTGAENVTSWLAWLAIDAFLGDDRPKRYQDLPADAQVVIRGQYVVGRDIASDIDVPDRSPMAAFAQRGFGHRPPGVTAT